MAVGAAGGATIITTVLGILINRIDLGMTLPAGDRRAARIAAQPHTTQAEPAFLAQPTTPGLEAPGSEVRGHRHVAADPTIKIAPTIGTATALELLGDGKVLGGR